MILNDMTNEISRSLLERYLMDDRILEWSMDDVDLMDMYQCKIIEYISEHPDLEENEYDIDYLNWEKRTSAMTALIEESPARSNEKYLEFMRHKLVERLHKENRFDLAQMLTRAKYNPNRRKQIEASQQELRDLMSAELDEI